MECASRKGLICHTWQGLIQPTDLGEGHGPGDLLRMRYKWLEYC